MKIKLQALSRALCRLFYKSSREKLDWKSFNTGKLLINRKIGEIGQVWKIDKKGNFIKVHDNLEAMPKLRKKF